MSTHTPAPWFVEQPPPDAYTDPDLQLAEEIKFWIIAAPSDVVLAGVNVTADAAFPNAVLMAAAPDLLAAGIQIRNVLGRLVMAVIMGHKVGEEMEAAVNEAQDAMNAAIARAEGKGQAA